MMRALIAVGRGGFAVLLAHQDDASDPDRWEHEIDATGSAFPDDLGMDTPEDHGIHVWEGTVRYSKVGAPFGEDEGCDVDWPGTWRKSTVDEIARFQAGESVWPS